MVVSPLGRQSRRGPYLPPKTVKMATLGELLSDIRPIPESKQDHIKLAGEPIGGLRLWCAGDLSLRQRPCVSVVGSRKVSSEGAARARRIARDLVKAGVVVVSGLAYGVDTQALTAAIKAGGRTIGVIGTPITIAYPRSNSRLQELIYREHLLISQFDPRQPVSPRNFPQRNRLMAAISDATVIIEASDTSGSLHQAAECLRLNRWLFIAKSVVDNPMLQWPSRFTKYPRTIVLTAAEDVLKALEISRECHSV